MPSLIRFDVTRLFAAHGTSKALRGIDRTERHLARWAADTTAFRVEWVRQRGQRLVGLTDAQVGAIIKFAEADWDGMDGGAFSAKRWSSRWTHRPLEPGPAVVFNAGHKGLEHCATTTPATDRLVPFVHDLIPITHPDTVLPSVVQEATARMDAVSRRAAALMVNSNATANEFKARYNGSRAIPPITVAALGPALPIHRPYAVQPAKFVFLSSIEVRKNLGMLLDVWETFAGEPGAPTLDVIGHRHSDKSAATRLDKGLPNVRDLGVLSDERAAATLAEATALLRPSVTEGYGMPIVEAHAMGVPVIASDVPAHREVGGAGAIYLPHDDHAAWRAALLNLSHNADARAALVAAIPPVPTWDSHFALVENVLSQVSDGLADQPAGARI